MGYIFEAEIESIIHAVRIKTIGEDDEVILKKVLVSWIHPAIKAYFKAEVEKMLLRERGSENRSKKFSYSLPEVRSLEEQIDLLLIQNYQFNRQEFDRLLDESVHFQFNYLCRPQWTLMNFIVGAQRSVSSSTIEKRLMYCVDYTYFPELIRRYLIDHGLAEVTYDEFKTLIEKIDLEVVAQHSSYELAHMTRALFEFVESGKMVPQVEFEQQTLPINAAIVFFDDKHLPDISRYLEHERDDNRAIQITVDRLAELIETIRSGNKEEVPSPVINYPEVVPEEKQAAEVEKDQLIVDMTESKGEENEKVEKVSEDEISPADIVPSFEPDIKERPVFSSEAENKRALISALFTEKEDRLFIKKLFAKDETAFHGALTEIGSLDAWESVAQYLDILFVANDVDPFSKEAVLFTDKLFTFFNSGVSEK